MMNDTPVIFRCAEPFAVARPNVDIDGAEVVVLLMPWGARSRHLHVQLHSVHAQDVVSHVTQHVARRHHLKYVTKKCYFPFAATKMKIKLIR